MTRFEAIRAMRAGARVASQMGHIYRMWDEEIYLVYSEKVYLLVTWQFDGAQFRMADGTLCENCGSAQDVGVEDARTAYSMELPNRFQLMLGDVVDRNRDLLLCRGCAAEHHSYWDAQWALLEP